MVSNFPIEKNPKYSRKAGGKNILADGKISQKGNTSPNDKHLFLDHVSSRAYII
jgi:hypothetical protein